MDDQNLNEVYLFHLDKAAKQFKKLKNEVFKQAGIDLTGDQWILIKNIHEVEGINQRTLAKRVFKEPASITRILDILEKKQLVERRSIPNDRRTYALYTTDQGKALVQQIIPLAVNMREQGRKGLTEKEVEQLTILLKKVYDNLSSTKS